MRDSIRSTHAVSSLIDLFEWYYPLVSPQFLNINSIDTKFTIQTRHGNRGNGMFKSEIGEEISAKGKYLGVVGLETSPGNKPRRRARFVVVVINDLGRNVARRCRNPRNFHYFVESRVSSSSWICMPFISRVATGDVESRELLEEDFEIRGSIYGFSFFFFELSSFDSKWEMETRKWGRFSDKKRKRREDVLLFVIFFILKNTNFYISPIINVQVEM